MEDLPMSKDTPFINKIHVHDCDVPERGSEPEGKLTTRDQEF